MTPPTRYKLLAGFLVSLLSVGCGGLIPIPMVEKVPVPPTTGRVVSARTGAPVSGAQIVVLGHDETATTSDHGGYFTTLETTGHQFSFLSSGYTPQNHRLTITRAGFAPLSVPWQRPSLIGQPREDCPPITVGHIMLKPVE